MKDVQLFEATARVEAALRRGRVFLNTRSGDKQNSMVIGWGYIGTSWGLPVFMAMVRKSRYTHDLLEQNGVFTVSVIEGEGLETALKVCGSESGRDQDKFAKGGITAEPAQKVDCPIVAECNLHIECKVAYQVDMDGDRMTEQVQKAYPAGDFHTLYFGQVVACYER